MIKKLKFAVIGCGFWSRYQIPAWLELEHVELVALYNRTIDSAKELGDKYGINRIYNNIDDLFQNEQLDFVDIITDVDTHAHFTKVAAGYGVKVICQKPMAPNYEAAADMVKTCKKANVALFIHENFRWQSSIRKLKSLLDTGVIGKPFKGRIGFCSAYPVFDNQPFLATLEHFIISDLGSHLLDISRFLFGEASTLYCQTSRVNKQIVGEDVANIVMTMQNGVLCTVELSYASVLEQESFPQTLALIEGEEGSISLTHDFELRVTTRTSSYTVKAAPHLYSWLDQDYAVVHSSIVDCNKNLLCALLEEGNAETTGDDNLKTVNLVWAAYESATNNQVVNIDNSVSCKAAVL